jgi:signal transduction histidine kinase
MQKHLRLLISGVFGIVLVIFVAPVLVGLHRVVRDHGRIAVTRSDEHAVWLLFAILSVITARAGYMLSAYQVRRLTRHIERLVGIAERYEPGEPLEPLSFTGYVEIDQLAGTLQDSACRVRDAMMLERQFSIDLSRQLRTPLASLLLKVDALDSPRWPTEAMEAVRTDLMQMEQTIDELLQMDSSTVRLNSVVVLGDAMRRAG